MNDPTLAFRLVEVAPVGVLAHREGIIVYANEVAAEILGVPREALVGRPAVELVAPEDQDRVSQRVGRRARGVATPSEYEIVVRRPDGTRRHVEIQLRTGAMEVIILARDVTERVALRDRGFSFAQLGASIHLMRREGDIVAGLRAGMARADAASLLVQPSGDALEVRFVEGSAEACAVVARAAGRELAGAPLAWAPALREAWDRGGAFNDDGVAELAAMGGGVVGSFEGPDRHDVERIGVAASRVEGWPGGAALLVLAGSSIRKEDVPVARLLAAQVSAALENARDLARARRRERELEALENLARAMLAAAKDGSGPLLRAACEGAATLLGAAHVSAWIERDGSSLRLAAAWPPSAGGAPPRVRFEPLPWLRAMLEAGEPELLGDTPDDLRAALFWRDATTPRALWLLPLRGQGVLRGALVVGDAPGRRLDDGERALARALARVVEVGLENADLQEEARRRLQALTATQSRLVQRERLAALGELSAVMAHEVRNPLGVIFNSLGSLDRLLKPEGDAKLLLDIVREESDRLNRIVGDLLDFARPMILAPLPVSADRLLDEAWSATAAASAAPATVTVRREFAVDLPPLEADPRLLRQALVNVMTNALQAMPTGGFVTLRTRAVDGPSGVPSVELEVEDSGPGLGKVDAARVFEPFFTSKATGTGLGLAVVRRIVEEHGGAASLQSAPGRGAVFVARLPTKGTPPAGTPMGTPADGLPITDDELRGAVRSGS